MTREDYKRIAEMIKSDAESGFCTCTDEEGRELGIERAWNFINGKGYVVETNGNTETLYEADFEQDGMEKAIKLDSWTI